MYGTGSASVSCPRGQPSAKSNDCCGDLRMLSSPIDFIDLVLVFKGFERRARRRNWLSVYDRGGHVIFRSMKLVVLSSFLSFAAF